MRSPFCLAMTLAVLAAGCGAPEPAEKSTDVRSDTAGLTTFQRCQSGLAPDYSETVDQSGGQVSVSFPNTINPPNFIFPGDVVRVSVSGSVRYDYWGDMAGPNGIGVVAPGGSGFPAPGFPEVASVAIYNNNPGGWVGGWMLTSSLSSCAAAPGTPARLFYYINDNNFGDNGGSFRIRTDVYRAPILIAIDDIELTQGVQTAGNKVPLIAGKRTFVRAYIRGTDDGLGPLSGVTATATVDGDPRTFFPIPNTSITASTSGSDRRSLANSFLFEIDGSAINAGTRNFNLTVNPPPGRGSGLPVTRSATAAFSSPAGSAASINVFGVRYSYYNVPPVMQGLTGRTDGWWQARPVAAWDQMRITAENALPTAHLFVNDTAPSASWGATWFDCRATQDPRSGTWGCAGYEDGRTFGQSYIDGQCPNGGCWVVVLQPEIDPSHHGAHLMSPRGNHVINLQGELQPTEQGLTLAHEIGHGLSLVHTWEDASYPRSGGGLGPYVGFRSSPSNALVAGTDASGATTAYDLMSYSSPAWFSPYSYCKALAVASNNGIVCPADTPR